MLPPGAVHQGLAFKVQPLEGVALEDLAEPAEGVIVMLDQLTDPQNVGALGAAMLAAQGLGIYHSVEEATTAIPLGALYEPNPEHKAVYDRNYAVYTALYKSNKKHFAALNGL